jgi:hypothetical protein
MSCLSGTFLGATTVSIMTFNKMTLSIQDLFRTLRIKHSVSTVFYSLLFCGLYYKHVTIVNDTSSGINKLKASLNDAARGVIYEHHMFIVQGPIL